MVGEVKRVVSVGAWHNYRGDDHPVSDCALERCGITPEKAAAYADAVRSAGGACACGRVIGRRCGAGLVLRECPSAHPTLRQR